MKEKVLKTTIIQMIGVVMAQCILISYNPIGIAFFAASYALSAYRWVTFPVMLLSMSTVFGIIDLSKYAMIMLVIIACYGLLEIKKKKVSSIFLAILTGVSIFVLELTDTLMTPLDLQKIILNFFVGILAAGLTLIFYKAIEAIQSVKRNSILKNEEMISIAIVIGLIMYYITGLQILPSGISEAVIYFVILYFGYRYGAGMGAIIGSACGIVLSIAQGSLEILGIMCALGILVGTFRELGKAGSVIAFCCGVISASYLFNGLGLELDQIKGVIISSAVFVLLPRRVLYKQEKGYATEPMSEDIHNSDNYGLTSIAESFNKLASSFSNLPAKRTSLRKSDVEDVFEEVSNNFCRNCEKCTYCWNDTANKTYEETKTLLRIAENGNAICIEDIPKSFMEKCSNTSAFISEINHLFDRARLNLIWYNKLVESREAVAGQLKEVAVIIEDYSKNVYNFVSLESEQEELIRHKLRAHRIVMKKIVMIERKNHIREIIITAKTERGGCVTAKDMAKILGDIIGKNLKTMKDCKKLVSNEYSTYNIIEDTNFYVMHGTARKMNDDEKVSGDNFAIMDFGLGQMLASLSDGMGSGLCAYKDSETVIELLEQLLESGFSEEVSLKLINSVMLLNTNSESPATLDMAIIDLYSGLCDFIKLGAASTFIKRGNWVESLKSTTLPVGVLNNIDIESVNKKLYNGDFIIMVSDGITDTVSGEDKEREISKIIMDIESKNPNEIANHILEKTLINSEGVYNDDMTVLVIGLWEKCA